MSVSSVNEQVQRRSIHSVPQFPGSSTDTSRTADETVHARTTQSNNTHSSRPKSQHHHTTDNQSVVRNRTRARSSSTDAISGFPKDFLFTPASPPLAVLPRSPQKSNSSPFLHSNPNHSLSLIRNPTISDMRSDSDEEENVLYTRTSWYGQKLSTPNGRIKQKQTSINGSADSLKPTSTPSLRTRLLGSVSFTGISGRGSGSSRNKSKMISTTPGRPGAGETETEADEPPRHLPTSRIIHSSGPLIPPNTLQARLTPLLFEFSRLLSIVPAIFGTLYNLYHILYPPDASHPATEGGGRRPPERVDYFVSALWAILTGFQCLRLTTGLLTRWRLYYPPLSTLIRLLALQGICWPATHLTLKILEHEKRPVIVWAVIATTTSVSRSVQIWVTSNLWWEMRDGAGGGGVGVGNGTGLSDEDRAKRAKEHSPGYWKRWGGGKWGGRRWDWKEVVLKCVLPVGVVYFVMAWAEALRREWSGC